MDKIDKVCIAGLAIICIVIVIFNSVFKSGNNSAIKSNNTIRDNTINSENVIDDIKSGKISALDGYINATNKFWFTKKLYENNIWQSLTYEIYGSPGINDLSNQSDYLKYQIQSVYLSKALDAYLSNFEKSSYEVTKKEKVRALRNISKIFYCDWQSKYIDDDQHEHGIDVTNLIAIGALCQLCINCRNGDNYYYQIVGDGSLRDMYLKMCNNKSVILLDKRNDKRINEAYSFCYSFDPYRYYKFLDYGDNSEIIKYKLSLLQ